MNEAVLDSSAILALLQAEPGAELVLATLPGALLSAVNLAEVVSKLCEHGIPAHQARAAITRLGVEVIDFDIDQAWSTGELRPRTRSAGLSLGDRACLALAASRHLPAMTTNRAWAKLSGFDIVMIR